jgi:ribosomal-protein-alanine N-acetyltransferase
MIGRATIADCEVLEAIHAESFTKADAWSRDVFALQLLMPNVIGLLHAAGGLILLRFAADEAEILTLAVAPAIRRGRIGTVLLQSAIQAAHANGAQSVFLEVSVLNTAALALYTASGFKQAGRRRQYYSDRSDALVLRMDLCDHIPVDNPPVKP